MRTIRLFNDDWLFAPRPLDEYAPDSAFERVTLPHTNVTLPYHNFDNAEYQFISTYRKRFTLPEPLNGRRVYLDFDGAMIASTAYLNGQTLGAYGGGYTPFSYDITDALRGGENLLTVRLDSTERKDIPPYGYVVDYLTFGGIYRDVWLRYVEPCHLADVFVRTPNVLAGAPTLEVDVTVRNQSDTPARRTVAAALGGISAQRDVSLAPRQSQALTLVLDRLPQVERWSLDNPALYDVRVRLQADAALTDEQVLRIGFREARFDRGGSFYLNGEPVKLRGLDRHQTYPYIGAAAPARLQRKDADILKYELGCNIVRTSHYPQSPHFLNRCDEIGLLVFEEIPGWQFIGDQDWKALSLRDVEAMIVRDRNHPSIVLWGVRINESQDDHDFYAATNALAHRLDPTRQTGGVRNFIDSEFLEDVYTFNDFSRGVLEPRVTPHLITEFNGHMFPTKTFDNEDRAVEHALRHAHIQNLAHGNPRVAGAIGWCAFDYNTHREFGSGDRICYHGVSDMFRLPKFAAYAYESQIAPSVRPVLRAATYWTWGDRAEGGNDPLTIFSNCDEIEVFVGDRSFGRYQPDRMQFPHLPHPPFMVRFGIVDGDDFQDLRVVGYVGGQAVIEERHSATGLPKALLLEPDDAELNADGADTTRLVFKIVDEYGNRLPFAVQVVTFEIEGPADLIGENPFALVGGQAALYVRARREPGAVTVRATTPRLPPAQATIQTV